MKDIDRFVVFMAAAAAVFNGVLLLVMRRRTQPPSFRSLVITTSVVVVIGMLFARYGHIFFHPPWWIYYGVPALSTFLLPPVILRMKRSEIAQYIPLAVLMAPAIHIFFSLFVGWHDYMPFPFYIPSLFDIARRLH